MGLDSKKLKALGFELVGDQLVPIEKKSSKLKDKRVVKNSSVKSEYSQPKINTNNPFFKYLSYEDLEHIKVVNYLKQEYPSVIFFHPQNEGKRSAFEMYKYSLMGSLKGCPDIVIAHPKYRDIIENGRVVRKIVYFGMYIELKSPEHTRIIQKGKRAGKTVKAIGKVSPEQLDVINKLNKIGYKACVCYGAEEAKKAINEYFRG